MTKLCIKCQTTKPRREFGKDKRRPDGLFPYCKRCRLRNPERHDEIKEMTARGLHWCSCCKKWKRPDDFYNNPSKKNGIHHECKKCAKRREREWRKQNPEAAKKKDYDRYWNNPEGERGRFKLFYRNNHEQQRERASAYWKTPEGRATQARANAKRGGLIKAADNTLTEKEWRKIISHQDNKCLACGVRFTRRNPPTRDHVVPVTKGGALTYENTQALCKPCNSSKGNKTIDYRKEGGILRWIQRKLL